MLGRWGVVHDAATIRHMRAQRACGVRGCLTTRALWTIEARPSISEEMEPPRLHVDVDGVGPPIVLAHGFGGSARNFGPQMRALKDRYQVVRYDARGHGRSDAPTEPEAYTPAAFVGDSAAKSMPLPLRLASSGNMR